MSSNEQIQVAVRFRPPNPTECEESQSLVWTLTKNGVSLRNEYCHLLASERKGNPSAHMQFDCCFSWEDDNQVVYDSVAKSIVLSTLEGYNATIFAYGQTGSGKTYTMLGLQEGESEQEGSVSTPRTGKPVRREQSHMQLDFKPLRSHRSSVRSSPSSRSSTPKPELTSLSTSKRRFKFLSKGVILLALEDIFREVQSSTTKKYFFTCSYMEIYNEHVYDLLKTLQDLKFEGLSVTEGADKEFTVRNLSEQVVTSIEDVLLKLEKGEDNRHYASTALNHNSSRSHTIFRLTIRSIELQAQEDSAQDIVENVTTESVLNFVDLAGSEKISGIQAAAEAERQPKAACGSFVTSNKSDADKIVAEGKNINTSLFFLCQVINKLAEQKLGIIKPDAYIPFRNSNLTKILRSSLGGNARTCIICTATPVLSQLEQTYSTLRFGSNARSVTNKVRANIKRETNAKLLLAYEQDIAVLRKELEVASHREKMASSETTNCRLQLESRVKKLSMTLFEKSRHEVTFQRVSKWEVLDLWAGFAGDLFLTRGLEQGAYLSSGHRSGLSEIGKRNFMQLKELNSAQFESSRTLKDLNTSMKSNENAVEKVIPTQLKQELERTTNIHQELKDKKHQYKENLRRSEDELSKLSSVCDLYEQGTGLECMSEYELERFEGSLLRGLDAVKLCKANRASEKVIASLVRKLQQFVSAEELVGIMDVLPASG